MRIIKQSILFCLICALFIGCMSANQNKVKIIQNNFLKVGILTDVGGRIVFLSSGNDENMLYSNNTYWNEPENERIKPAINSEFKAYDGFITWLGPQSEWWEQQTVNPEKRNENANWPPDPFLIYGNYKIVEHTDTSILIEGEGSPVSGLKLYKEFIIKENSLLINVRAQNIRETPVSWDLWSNIRLPGYTDFIIPSNPDQVLRIESHEDSLTDTMNYNLYGDFFSYRTEKPSVGKNVRWSKAFLDPDKGLMAAFAHDNMLLISFDKVSQENIHSEHGFVEVFNRTGNTSDLDLLELEHHSAYKTIKPGEFIELNEIWELFPCTDCGNKRKQIKFFEEIVK